MANRQPIPKVVRESVRNKYGGKCAYCGCDLPERFHVDHLVPISRKYSTNDISNLMPACPQCNNFKHTWSLEDFRRELQLQVERARKHSVNFRNCERFGLINITNKPIIFWFEKFGIQE